MKIEASRKGRAPLRTLGTTGSAIVEFAFIAPVLLLIVLGTAQFGIALGQYVMLMKCRGRGCDAVRDQPLGHDALYRRCECGQKRGADPDARESDDHLIGQWDGMRDRRSVRDGADKQRRATRDGVGDIYSNISV